MEVRPITASGDIYTDGLVFTQAWAQQALTFSFPGQTGWGYAAGEPFDNFAALNTAQQDTARAIFGQISSFTNLTLSELSGTEAQQAVLRFGLTNDTETAHAYLPETDAVGGDSWYRNDGTYAAPAKGNYAWFTFLHEIGHALGLTHPHDGDAVGGVMPLGRDWMAWTVMSYRSGWNTSFGYANEDWSFAQTYMPQDIAALQYIYGANFSHNSGASTYRWNQQTGELSINGVGQGAPGANTVFQTIWDGGGTDSYDLSNHTGVDLAINLLPGGWSSFGAAQLPDLGNGNPFGSVANAWQFQGDGRSLIENAIGSAGNDTFWANAAINHLSGGAGNDVFYAQGGGDTLLGEAGDDTFHAVGGGNILNGGTGSDTYYLTDAGEVVIELPGEGANDRVVASGGGHYAAPAGIETIVQRATGASTIGNELNNFIYGETVDGGAGADVMIGHTIYVDNSLDLAFGRDFLNSTIFASVSYTIPELKTYWLSFEDRIEAGGTSGNWVHQLILTGTANIDATGNSFNDRLQGNAGRNVLSGLGGADTLTGVGNNDTLIGGDGNDYYILSGPNDVVVELADGGNDTLEVWANFTPGNNIESAHAKGNADLRLTGDAGQNDLTGNDGNNIVDGKGGDDQMTGGRGDDIFHVDNVGDRVRDWANAGYDTVYSSVSFASLNNWGRQHPYAGVSVSVTHDNEIELIVLIGTGDIDGSGDSQANEIRGNPGRNSLFGGAGDDSLIGGKGADLLTGGGDNDTFAGIMAEFAGDTVTDFDRGDRIHLTNADYATFTFTQVNDTLVFGGVNLTIADSAGQRFYKQAAADGGVEIRLGNQRAPDDYSGDGRSDALWLHSSGSLTYWRGHGTGFEGAGLTYPFEFGQLVLCRERRPRSRWVCRCRVAACRWRIGSVGRRHQWVCRQQRVCRCG